MSSGENCKYSYRTLLWRILIFAQSRCSFRASLGYIHTTLAYLVTNCHFTPPKLHSVALWKPLLRRDNILEIDNEFHFRDSVYKSAGNPWTFCSETLRVGYLSIKPVVRFFRGKQNERFHWAYWQGTWSLVVDYIHTPSVYIKHCNLCHIH